MNPSVYSLLCACGIAGLLYLDREGTVHVSKALWLPGMWIGIVGSRSISEWFGISVPGNLQGSEGSPVDAAVLGALLAAAIVVLIRRKSRPRRLLLANWPILVYFLFCLVSIAWSYHPDIAFKRWIKAIGDVAMVTLIATDPQPVAAIRRLVSRLGFLLLPTSVLFIRYLGDLGRRYTSDGTQMYTGVTNNKNSLGLTVLVVSLVVFWNVHSLLVHKNQPNRGRRLVAQSILLGVGLELFVLARSSTCKACFLLGSVLIAVLNLNAFKRRPARVHALCFALLLAAGVSMLLGGQGDAMGALGRDSSLSGRTDIWAAVISAAPNSIVGAGFESFWSSPNAKVAIRTLLDLGFDPYVIVGLNEAHNGYVEIYLQLGWVGVCLIAFFLISGYMRACKAYQRDPELGAVLIAYVAVSAVYPITEAGFRTLSPSWIFFLLAVVSATGVTAGLFGPEKSQVPTSRNSKLMGTSTFDELIPETEPRLAARRTLGFI
jgi:exopolysaccharide production protein ExoQ